MAPFLQGGEDDPTASISPLALLLSGYQQQKAQQNGALSANANGPNLTVASAAPPIASTPTPAAGTVVGQVPTQPAAATTDALSKPLPQAPQIDPRYAGLEASIAKDSQPTNPHDPNVKPRWWERLLGAGVGFGVGFKEGPTAGIQAGGAVTNRRFNQAEGIRQGRLAGEQSQAGEMERGYGLARNQFEDEMKGAQEERQRANESSLAGERAAKSAKYENAIDPNSIRYDENQDKFFGHSYGDPNGKEIETAPPKGWRSNAGPKTYEQLVIAEAQEKDPVIKAQYGAALKRIEGTEDKRFRYKAGSGDDKPMTPGEKLRRNVEINKAGAARQKANNELEEGNPAKAIVGYKATLRRIQNNSKLSDADKQKQIDALNEEHRQNKQEVEDQYAQQLNTLGVDYQPVQYGKDGSAQNANAAAAAKAAPASGGKQNASITAGPPPQAFTKGEGVVHYFKNPKTQKTEPWILKNGKPQRAQ